ncbi:MAG: NFACT family protein [Lachnospiraceae bacterium]
MALDGIVVANLVSEMNHKFLNGRISKISQPETDELLFTLKGSGGQYRLLISVNASLPFVYLTDKNKPSPLVAPNFCMLLRKHISNGRITSIHQPGLERIINIEIEHLNELGDFCKKILIVELMGKHSNIIFCKEDLTIIDSIKHISSNVSSVREVLPGRTYFIPDTTGKINPRTVSQADFFSTVYHKPMSISDAIFSTFTGISHLTSSEICNRAGVDGDDSTSSLDENARRHLFHQFEFFIHEMEQENFCPTIIYKGKEPIEFTAFPYTIYTDMDIRKFESISEVLSTFYTDRNNYTRIRQKSQDLRRIVTTALERNRKKYALQMKQLKDTEKRDKFRIYGELLNTYGYTVEPQSKEFEVLNYYTDQMIKIPLDPELTPLENAKKYFERYNKLKRTYEALSELVEATNEEIAHLESISTSLDIALNEDDLVQIREELVEFGHIRKKRGEKKVKVKSRPFHFISSDGFHMYVGKNNFQNDELTFKFATGNDWWFHAKDMPGSHVIVKSNNEELPDATFEEAGRLAAYFSKGREGEKVEVDYLQRKNVKKPNKGAPGFVIYYTNYSMTIQPDLTGIQEIDDQ